MPWLAPLAVLCASSCLVPSEPPPLDDGDLESLAVEPPRDAVFRPDEDQKESRAPETAIGGRLPGAFPEDFRLPEGSTVVDFGEVQQEGDEVQQEGDEVRQEGDADAAAVVEFVSLRLPLGAPAARDWLLREAQAAGWRASLGDVMTFRQDDRWVRVALEPGRAADNSAARIEYPKP